ncbi:MAG: T9SS type A sorting domain-containing protein [Flavobacteriales bacterium]|nr:T9SS type A sorting domain-containing protein [Flavobacteriales bacterium]
MAYGQMGCIDRYLIDPLTYTNIVTSADQVSLPRDLDFKPNSNELWVMNRGTASSGGSMVIVKNAGLPGQTDVYKKDSHSSHFMIQASAMAFSPNGEWAAVSEVQNTASASSTFMGPGLWSADPGIFATVFQNNWVNGLPLGSHRDMLHQSPFAMGIAADSAKVYWVMDGHNGNICRYDFVEDHGPGYDNHGAGKIWRYIDVPVSRVANVPSHMVLDRENHWLYFIDGASKQIKRLNTLSGSVTGNLTVPSTANEPLAAYKKVEGATVEIVDTWATGQPCGIDHVDGRLVVTDNTNGDIHLYDVTAAPTQLGVIPTGQAGIMGVKVGPDGRIWFVNYTGNKVVRIDPLPMADDGAITAIVAPSVIATEPDYYSTAFDLCASSVAPVVTLTNAGLNDITSADIEVSLEDGTSSMFSWSGTLTPNTSVDVTLPAVALTPGTHKLSAMITLLNGAADMNMMNDQLDGSFRAMASATGLPFNEGFEGAAFPPADWSYVHFNKNLYMDRVTGASGMGWSTACLKMDNFSGDMDITGQKDYMMLPPLDLSGAPTGTEIGFHVAYRPYNSSSTDALRVKVSTNCGSSWSTLYDKQGGTLATGPATTSAYTPSAAEWRLEQVDLSSVIGQAEVLLMFETESNWGNNVFIDDVQVGTAVGIEEEPAVTFALYPNPATDLVRLDLGALNGRAEVTIIDAAGRLLVQRNAQASTQWLDISALANGTYTVVVRAGGGTRSRPLVVLR